MSTETRAALEALPELARAEFMEWFRNKLCVLAGSNDLEAGDDRLPALVRGYAAQRRRVADVAQQELAEMLGQSKGDLCPQHKPKR